MARVLSKPEDDLPKKQTRLPDSEKEMLHAIKIDHHLEILRHESSCSLEAPYKLHRHCKRKAWINRSLLPKWDNQVGFYGIVHTIPPLVLHCLQPTSF
ncbi:unnamed protein product [Dovyalis caffra]|uniref:Uncharacterized protein n=1 Tax=Dovyalis caffra TaxID=77055 RepID=A0AAV1S0Z1_9ROSI|nr:unnamed protein product [Dovyalis caffra]